VKELILIVEDNDKNLKLTRDLLRFHGFDTIEAMNAEDGIELARERRPQLVLMDIQLPGRDGFALLREIRQSPFSKLRVVALTAHAMTGDRERALEAGFDGYITKPIDIHNFPTQISRALSGERPEG
jgi:CheY-like chemotaxis protein